MDKKSDERVLYDNYPSTEAFEYAKGYLLELAEDTDTDNKTKEELLAEIADQDVYCQMTFEDERNFEDFKSEFTSFINKSDYGFILMGSCGLWNGRKAAGTIINRFSDLTSAFHDYIKFYDVGGHLYFESTHHDGTNSFEIKELTEKGRYYLDNHIFDSLKDAHCSLFNSNFYSKLPRYAEKVWGCKAK